MLKINSCILGDKRTARGSVRGGRTTIFSRLCTTIFHSSCNMTAITLHLVRIY